ncbi:MAG: hypothetical protein AAF297_11510 [Planctomycetota bacterium]
MRTTRRRSASAALFLAAAAAFGQTASPAVDQPMQFQADSQFQAVLTQYLHATHYQLGDIRLPQSRNAALMYLRYIEVLADETRDEARSYLSSLGDDAAPASFDERLAKYLTDARDVLDGFERASQLPNCDFGVELELGHHALLTHLGGLRAVARVLAADAYRLALDEQPVRAANRVATLHRLAEHLASDRVAISALVGVALHALAADTTTRLLDHDLLTPEAKAVLTEAIDEVDPSNPSGVRGAIVGESVWVLDVLERSARSNDTKVIADMVELIDSTGANDSIRELRDARPSAVLKAIEQAREYQSLIIEHWDDPDAVAKLEGLQAMVASNAFGPIAKNFSIAAPRVRASTDRIGAQLETLRARLEQPTPNNANLAPTPN